MNTSESRHGEGGGAGGPDRARETASVDGPSVRARPFADRAALIEALAERLARAIEGARSAGPRWVMLCGGETPIPAYLSLARRGLQPSAGLVLFFSDERYVPASSQASNYHQTRPLLDALRLAPQQLLRVRTELPLAQAAADYDRALASLAAGGARLELALLGLGADGHTASLFAPEDLERASGRRAIAVHRPDGRDAVSVTPQVLERAEQVVFVVAGESKRTALARLLARDCDLIAWRAVSRCKAVEAWTDREALPTS